MVVTRPAVAVGEDLGFLPGNMDSKMEPWVRPIFDALHKHASPLVIQKLMGKRVLEVCPLGYMRGRTFESTWIVADELQNCTPSQMLMLLTRVGHGSKLVSRPLVLVCNLLFWVCRGEGGGWDNGDWGGGVRITEQQNS